MEFREVVRRRRMVRSFTDRPLPPGALDRMLDHARRAPSAGYTQGWAFLVLEGADETARFWDATLPAEERATFPWPGLLQAPAIVVALSDRDAYLDRYAEPDKGWTDRDEARWPVPYWDVDTGMATLLLLLTAVDEGLGALLFGVFPARQPALRAAFGIPDRLRPVAAVAVGHPAGDDRPSGSVSRGRRPRDEVVHRGSWGGPR